MISNSLFDRYENLLKANIGHGAPARLDPADKLADLGLDNSLTLVQLVVQIEQEFNIDMPAKAFTAESFESVDSLWSVLSSALGARQRS